ncbi:dUTP diphosphatase [Virgibacillus salarius]|uniref:dUTP diphosphatase n=1 Tax=Virgibacillus salarius TaxID=447199 RepID=UPI00248F7B9D|nr:dUTP diphosphatase [Virgibacillus salarius]WBX81311.1 dUTP diphosphatase [Virgibacillus salarius]
MNLNKLFPIQKELDTRIEREKGLEGQNLLDKKILALQVELGELANEWRGFKFWSKDQEPNTEEAIKTYYALREGKTRNPLLEEYVDCLHFILSIGLDKNLEGVNVPLSDRLQVDITTHFNEVFFWVSNFRDVVLDNGEFGDLDYIYRILFMQFIRLGEMLGFTIEQIEQAYLDKNKVNHERQANGY